MTARQPDDIYLLIDSLLAAADRGHEYRRRVLAHLRALAKSPSDGEDAAMVIGFAYGMLMEIALRYGAYVQPFAPHEDDVAMLAVLGIAAEVAA